MGQALPPAEGTSLREPALHNQTDHLPNNVSSGANGREPAAPEDGLSAPTLATTSPIRVPLNITLEGLLYVVILLAAALTRFWDLGSRALHHDESLHAYFSWLLATGQNYVHDPLMHGPFLFHFNALI